LVENGSEVKKPTQCKVGALKVKIRWNKKLKDYGTFAVDSVPTITIRSGLDSTLMAETFLHELFHLLWWTSTATDPDTDTSPEEAIVSRLSSALMNFWHQNPRIHDWWTSLIR
jgi:hypothetical protein